jgi:hypothetical protein
MPIYNRSKLIIRPIKPPSFQVDFLRIRLNKKDENSSLCRNIDDIHAELAKFTTPFNCNK